MRACVTPDYVPCWTYHWAGTGYIAKEEDGLRVARIKLLEFSPNQVKTWSELPNGYWASATGSISPVGEHVMDGQYDDSNGTHGTVMWVWGKGLDDMPLPIHRTKFDEQDSTSRCIRWITGIECDRAD